MGDDFCELFDLFEIKLNILFYDDVGNICVDLIKFDELGWFDESWE